MASERVPQAGEVFGWLTIVEVYYPRRRDQARVRCVCKCGKQLDYTPSRLYHNEQKSCGCYRRDRAGKLYRTRDGLSQTLPFTMFYDARKRATREGLPFDIEPSDIVIPTHCPVLGIKLELGSARDSRVRARASGDKDRRPSLDRIIPVRGYVRGNIAVISFAANRKKNDSTLDELRAIVRYIEDAC